MIDKDEFLDKAKEQIDHLKEELADLEAKSRELGNESAELYKKQSAELHDLMDEAAQKFEKARASSEEAWEHTRDFVDLTGKAVRNSYHYFLSHYHRKQ